MRKSKTKNHSQVVYCDRTRANELVGVLKFTTSLHTFRARWRLQLR